MVTRLEMLGVLDGALAEAEAKLRAFADVEDKSEAARAQLAATLGDLETANKQLQETRGKLADVEKALSNKEHLFHNEQARSLANVNRQVGEAQEELKRLQADVTNSKAEYNEIVAGMQTLRQRLG
jgi:chromosome segregation ATPase